MITWRRNSSFVGGCIKPQNDHGYRSSTKYGGRHDHVVDQSNAEGGYLHRSILNHDNVTAPSTVGAGVAVPLPLIPASKGKARTASSFLNLAAESAQLPQDQILLVLTVGEFVD